MRNCGLQCNGRFFSSSLPPFLCLFLRLPVSHPSLIIKLCHRSSFCITPTPFPFPATGGSKANNPSIPSTFPSETNDASAIRNTYTPLSRWEQWEDEGEALILLHLSKRRRRSSYSANFVKGVANLELVADASVARGMTMVGTTTNSSSSAATRTKT